jgi:signal transduction histidine kinase
MRRWERRQIATIALPPLIAVMAALAAWQLVRAEDNRRDARLSARAESTASALRQRIGAYTDVLYGLRGLFEASDNGVTRREFHDHVRAVDVARRYPGVQAVGLAELVPTDDPSDFVRAVRRDARRSGLRYPPFTITGRAELERRLVVDYIEPQRGNAASFGFDVFSEPTRRRAAERALETGVATASAPISLVADPRSPGLGIFLPVHAGAVTGTAFAAFRVADLVRGVQLPEGPATVTLQDVGPDRRGPVSERSRAVTLFAGPAARAAEITRRSFDVLGRRWTLTYAPREAVLAPAERAIPWAVLAAGLALAALTAWLLTAAARTERRAVAMATRMTADLRVKEAELQRSNEELARFAYVASHDLREPLRSVTGFIGLLQRRHADRLDEDGRTWIGFAMEGTQRMNALIGDLLEYSRAGRPPGGRDDRVADLQLAWDHAVAGLTAAIAESGATVSAGPLPVVLGDQREMNQVMQNLLGNAIKYRGDRAPVVRAEAEARDGAWAVSVRDNGIGIERQHLDRIFVLFQRLHARDDYEGTGMGLSIVKKIVEARGGSVSVESSPGEGSCFTVVLPAAPA